MVIAEPQSTLKVVAMPGQTRSGDIGSIRQAGITWSFTLIDVLGHGNEAAELADAVQLYLGNSEIISPIETILDLHQQFRGSRGMVASNILLNIEANTADYCGIGNIATRIFGATNRQLVSRDGVIGYRMVNPTSSQLNIVTGDILLMHSDGISSRLTRDSTARIPSLSSEQVVTHLFNHYVKETDDASALAVRR